MEGWHITLANKLNMTSAATVKTGLYSLAKLMVKKEVELKIYGADLGGPNLEQMWQLEMPASKSLPLGDAKGQKKSKSLVSINVPRLLAPLVLFSASQVSVGGRVMEEVDDDSDNDMGLTHFNDGNGATVAPSQASVGGRVMEEEVDDDGDNDMGITLFNNGNRATVAPGANVVQHSLAGPNTYG